MTASEAQNSMFPATVDLSMNNTGFRSVFKVAESPIDEINVLKVCTSAKASECPLKLVEV